MFSSVIFRVRHLDKQGSSLNKMADVEARLLEVNALSATSQVAKDQVNVDEAS